MQDRAVWSLSLGHWGGVHVRLHMFFLLFAACALLLKWQFASPMAALEWVIPASLLVLFLSVLLHEVGHVWFARRHDGVVELIVIGPLGGMMPVHVIGDPRAEFKAHLAGPFVNLLVCSVCVPALMLSETRILGLLNPLSPVDVATGSTTEVIVKLTFWINWSLLVVNLIPAFPLDGAYALRAAILDRWPLIKPAEASAIVARTAQVLACLLAAGALLWPFDEDQLFLPIRFSLVVFAILLFFAARQRRLTDEREQSDNPFLGYEFTGSLAALERDLEESGTPRPGPLRRWIKQRRQARLLRQRQLEQEEERRVDEILTRLHEQGMQSLSVEDRAILDRVSARYRSRMEH
jgi:stage IV sporulation protein FB